MNGWKNVPIREIATLRYGKSLPADKRIAGRVPVYGSNGIVGWHHQAIVDSAGIIVGRKGTVGAIQFSRVPFCPIDTTYYIAENDTKVELRFLAYLLQYAKLSRLVSDLVPGLNRDSAEAQVVGVPTEAAEQRQIALVLSAVQRAIERQERLIALTAELKKALMHKLFTEGTRGEPLKQTEIGPVPESWDKVPLGTVVNLLNGFAFKSEDAVSASNTQLVRMGNLYGNRLDLSRSPLFYPDHFADRYQRFMLHDGDLIMSLTGTSGKEDFGFVVEIFKASRALLLNQRVVKLSPASSKLLKGYLLFFLQSRKFLDHLYPTAKGMKQANLSTNAMRKLLLVIPDMAEQRQIAICFRTLDAKLEVHRQKHSALSGLFRTLLHQLMTAQVRVHDLDLSALDELAVEPAGIA